MMRLSRRLIFACATAVSLVACQGTGGPIGPEIAQRPPASVSIAVGKSRTVSLEAGDVAMSVTVPPAVAGSGTIAIAASLTQPVQVGLPEGAAQTVTPPGTPIAFITLTASDTATYDTFPTLAFTLPAATTASASFYLNYASPTYELGEVAGPVSATGGTSVSFSQQTFAFSYPGSPALAPPLPVTLVAGDTYTFGLYEIT